MSVIRSILSWRTAIYLAYALLLTAVLLYVRFPTQKFKHFCENHLELIVLGSVCTIDRISYKFPLTFSFAGVHLRRSATSGKSGFFIDSFSVTPDLARLGEITSLSATLYGGVLSARLEGDWGAKKVGLHDIQLSGLDAAALQNGFIGFERKVTGTLGFTGSYQAAFKNPAGGTGQGRFLAEAGSFELLQPVLSLQQFDFHQVIGKLRYENRKLQVFDGKLNGKDLSADFTGELNLTSTLFSSEIQFTGRLVPQGAFLETHPQEQKMMLGVMKRYNMTALPFKVGGNLGSPTFRLSN